jgi:hypothetical protein
LLDEDDHLVLLDGTGVIIFRVYLRELKSLYH